MESKQAVMRIHFLNSFFKLSEEKGEIWNKIIALILKTHYTSVVLQNPMEKTSS